MPDEHTGRPVAKAGATPGVCGCSSIALEGMQGQPLRLCFINPEQRAADASRAAARLGEAVQPLRVPLAGQQRRHLRILQNILQLPAAAVAAAEQGVGRAACR